MDHVAEVTPWRWLFVIVVAALALRVGAVLHFGVPNIAGYSESGLVAKNLVQGRGFAFDLFGERREQPLRSFIPPLFPALLAFCLRTFADPQLALGLIQSGLSSLAALFVYFVAKRLAANQAVALLAAFGVACYPVFVIMSAFPPSMALDLFLLAWFLLLITAAWQDPTWPKMAAAGFVLGLAVLSRPMMLGFLPLALGWYALNWRRPWTQWLRLAAVFAALTLASVLPWTVRNYLVHGRLILVSTNGGFVFWNGNNPFTTGSGLEVDTKRLAQYMNAPYDPQQPAVVEALPYPLPAPIQAQIGTISEVELDRQLFQAGLQFIREEPKRWLALEYAKLRGFWWFRENIGAKYEASWTQYYKLAYAALLTLAAPGVWLSLSRRRAFSLLYLLVLYHLLVYVVFHIQTRYRWVIEPYYIIFAALAVVWLGEKVRARAKR